MVNLEKEICLREAGWHEHLLLTCASIFLANHVACLPLRNDLTGNVAICARRRQHFRKWRNEQKRGGIKNPALRRCTVRLKWKTIGKIVRKMGQVAYLQIMCFAAWPGR
ncbi:hypothetical protein LZ32DRAFT_210900 [Colletotrichum eremochloae]|nr:hypothetical protein LZ32DRAFT_210900 [Colletotrichum eremochloae]